MSSRKGTSGGTCEFCGNTYSKREHYERHVRTHTRERPFSCSQCPATFSRQDTLDRHARARHPGSTGISRKSGAAKRNGRQTSSPVLQDFLQTPPQSTAGATEIAPSHDSDLTLMPFSLDPPIASCGGIFDWPWDDSFYLDPTFSLEDLGTYDLNTASPSIPWLPLRSETERPNEDNSSSTLRPPPRMAQNWFTSMSSSKRPSPNRWPVPDISAHMVGEEISRDALASSLQQRVPDTTLPSTQFLNRCLHMFMTRLWPLVPIVHLPTFQPARTNPLLLLSICSLGALAIGSEEALYHGERLFDGVQKAILVSFSPNRVADEHTLAIIQAATIGQTYALLSGSATNLLTAQCFHGTLGISVRAYHDQMAKSNASIPTSNQPPSRADWNAWIREQTTLRLLNAIYVHNGEVFATVHQPAMLRVHPLEVCLAADDNLFLAKTADEWTSLMVQYLQTPQTPRSLFSSCSVLDSFVAEIYHRKSGLFNKNDAAVDKEFQSSLLTWFNDSTQMLSSDGAQRLSLLMLWHSCFVLLFSDIDVMEKVCGRDRCTVSEDDTQLLRSWVPTAKAKRCIAHALLVYSLVERLRVSDVPAIHVARVAWQAGLVLAIYSFFAKSEQTTNTTDIIATCPGLRAVRRTSLFTQIEWSSVTNNATSEKCRMVAFSLAAVLRHLGPWQNAARYAETFDRILHSFEPY